MKTNHIKALLKNLPIYAKWGLICLLLTPTLSYSQEHILVVMSNQGEIYQKFNTILENKLDKSIAVAQANLSDIDNEKLNQYNYIIPIGFKAAKAISKYKTNTPIIYSLIPDNESLKSDIQCESKSCYSIYINQPVIRYIKLFKALFPEGKELIFATTSVNSKKSQAAKKHAGNIGVKYKELYTQQDNVTKTLTRKLNNNNVLLALPNSLIYNAQNAKSIILSTYHSNVPIIAYSKSFAKAGALISLYSSIDNIAEKTASVVNKIVKSGPQKQKNYYPDDFSIEINSSVARSLDINIESETAITRKIK